jgi:mRNA-degrading endonuclease RelE of RelBE toxin-antitoxin system
MANNPQNQPVKLDLNNPEFLRSLLALDKAERNRVLDTLKKLLKLDWDQVYRDQGLKWEKITSVKPLKGIDVLYSLRITQSRRATAIRDGDFMRFQTVQPDHDSTYGKK